MGKQLERLFEAVTSQTIRLEATLGCKAQRSFRDFAREQIDPQELPDDVQDAYQTYKAKLVSNMTARERAEARLLARSQAAPPSMESLEGSIVWMPEELRGLDMELAVDRRSWTLTQRMHEASIFVVPDPSSRSLELDLCCALAGGWIFDGRMAMTNVGFCLKCLEPPGSKREILLTQPFRTENPACEQAFLHFEGPKLRVLDSMEVFADRKQKAINRKASAGVLAAIGQNEQQIFADVQHCFLLPALVEFMFRVDPTKTCSGITGR